jgi:hypothetical protein
MTMQRCTTAPAVSTGRAYRGRGAAPADAGGRPPARGGPGDTGRVRPGVLIGHNYHLC